MAILTQVHMPSLEGATTWLNSGPLDRAGLRGHVVLVKGDAGLLGRHGIRCDGHHDRVGRCARRRAAADDRFRQKYPRWWFDWNRELTRFSARVIVYAALLDDRYPSTDQQQSVRLELRYPDVPSSLNRWLPLVKWLLAVPHYIALALLAIAACACVGIAWFAILLTGRYPRPLFDFVVGVGRWGLRVVAYAFLLITDRYPPFSLRP